MRSRNSLAAHARARRTTRLFRVAAGAGIAALFLALFATGWNFGVRPADAQVQTANVGGQTAAQATDRPEPNVVHVSPVSVTTVNFEQLSRQAARTRKPAANAPAQLQMIHAPLTAPERDAPEATAPSSKTSESAGPAPSLQDDAGGPLVPSPTPAASYLGQEDGPKVGTTTFNIPPDTQGAVGLDKVFSNTNPNYRVQDKTTGAALSTVSSDTFWGATGGTNFFDPRITYDPYNNRWILAEDSNPQTATSSIEVAVSQTSDPQGSYFLFRFVVGNAVGSPAPGACGEWADFPMLGFNKNWVAVSMNMFQIQTSGTSGTTTCNGGFVEGKVLVLDYPQLRAGASVGTLFAGPGIGSNLHAVTTLDPNEPTLYMPQHLSSAGAQYDLGAITGTPSSPSLGFIGGVFVRPGGGWTQGQAETLSQQCIPGFPTAAHVCPATIRRMDTGDSQIRSAPVFRNGNIWYSQTILLPAGSLTTGSRAAVQWTKINTAGAFVDGGRIQDPTATLVNGGKLYAYSCLTVNKNNDMLIGFSQFASNQFASAGYALRLGTDAPGTTRDPVVYKAGEDYYQKQFSGTVNRWGDYSASHVDPVNDRDMWTVQEYAQQRLPPGTGTNDSRWGTFWAKVAVPAGAGDLLISEYRHRGPNGDNDEFVEIYNNNNAPFTVATADGSAGYALAGSDGVTRFTIPNGTTIPGRGHYLGVNSVGYSLAAYPAGNGTTATGDATYAVDIPNDMGIALFNTANSANFTLANRLDAVGHVAEANTLYKEGAGIPNISNFSVDYSFVRDMCGKGGQIAAPGPCTTGGLPKDSNDNAVDFILVDTLATGISGQQRLGAPGPENLSSPIQRNGQIPVTLLDPGQGSNVAPNRERSFTSDPANASSAGTLTIRRTVTNNSGSPVTRLRFRIVDLTTFPPPPGIADLRARTSTGPTVINITGTNPACPGGVCTVQATTLEQPPPQAPNIGGGFNASLSAGTVTLGTPIAPGGSINVSFLLGLQQGGQFRFIINVEALP
jgi:hypothetical protein